MAAIGFTPIQLFRTTTASATPSAPTLADGELAINLTDEKLYFKNAAGVVKLLAANLNAVANGGTGATSLSANGVLIGNGTSAVTTVTGTTGRVLTGNTGGAPSFEPIGNLAVSSISFGTTGLTPSAPSQGAITVGGTLSVANGGTGATTSTGTGSVVLNTSPTLVTPTLGAASATSIANGLGAVGTPSYTFTGDTNTGMWSPTADTLALSTGGAERVRINSSGDVGIGTSSPGYKLQVAGSFAAGRDTSQFITLTGDVGSNAITGVCNPTNPKPFFISTDANSTNMLLRVMGAHPLAFTTSNLERMRIDSSGRLLVATTSPLDFTSTTTSGNQISSTGVSISRAAPSLNVQRTSSDGALANFWRDTTNVGSISVTTTTTSYNITSDRRLKHDIVDAPDAADLIDAIKVRSFKWNVDDSEQRYGMIAQELLEVAPEAVSAPENPDEMMSVDYSKLVPMMLKEVQSLRARVAQLEGN